MLNSFYARPIREEVAVPKETQWFLAPFNENQLTHLRKVINTINPLLNEVSQLNQDFPTELAYLSEQTGNPALLLEIVAAKRLPALGSGVSEKTRQKAFSFFDLQMNKKDNVRLGYKINRKKEAFLFLQNQLLLKDPVINLRIYFEYLKKNFVKSDGTINLKSTEGEDFNSYILSKVEGIKKMISYEGISQIEREAARKWIKKTCKTLLGNCIEVEKKN